ncbi:MAG: hypothetical protein LIO87_05630 [Eubacterium sp.]|nr:hypothetical protein [Eubacterium sp.]
MAKDKQIKTKGSRNRTYVKNKVTNSDKKNVVWLFDNIDRDGEFAFNLDQMEKDGNIKVIFDKMLSYSTMTWSSVKLQTHDWTGKSKNHFINADRFSEEAAKRFEIKCSVEDADRIFSFALTYKLRIIGTVSESGEFFHVIWYDPNHKFYPVSR